jgi:hypothetical protein
MMNPQDSECNLYPKLSYLCLFAPFALLSPISSRQLSCQISGRLRPESTSVSQSIRTHFVCCRAGTPDATGEQASDLGIKFLWQVAEKGPGRLNACPTKACKPLIVRGGAGGFACRFQSSEPFSAACWYVGPTGKKSRAITSMCEENADWR